MSRKPFLRAAHIVDALVTDPHVRVLTEFIEGRRGLPAEWMTLGAAFPYPPAFIPIVHDTSGTMYGLWRHLSIARSVCFVGISAEARRADEIARTVQQFWAFLALLASTTIDGDGFEHIETFLLGTGISTSSVAETSRAVGDQRELFGAHPVFERNCPSALRKGGDADGQFPSLARPETWALACGYELQVADVSAPPWLQARGPSAFSEQVGARFWPGVWLSLNSPGWRIRDAASATVALPAAFEEARTTLLSDWVSEISGFSTGY